MKKVFYSVVLLLFLSSMLRAQEKVTPEVESFGKVSLFGFTNILAGYEVKIAPQMTFSIEGGGGFDFRHFEGYSFFTGTNYSEDVSAKVLLFKSNINYYYNYKKRVGKNRITRNNGANFITMGTVIRPMVSYMSDARYGIYKYQAYYGAWGMRRNLWKNWNMQFELGLGVLHEYEDKYDDWKGIPIINIQFSYNL